MNSWMCERVNAWIIAWLFDCVNAWVIAWMLNCVNAWIIAWMLNCVNAWVKNTQTIKQSDNIVCWYVYRKNDGAKPIFGVKKLQSKSCIWCKIEYLQNRIWCNYIMKRKIYNALHTIWHHYFEVSGKNRMR